MEPLKQQRKSILGILDISFDKMMMSFQPSELRRKKYMSRATRAALKRLRQKYIFRSARVVVVKPLKKKDIVRRGSLKQLRQQYIFRSTRGVVKRRRKKYIFRSVRGIVKRLRKTTRRHRLRLIRPQVYKVNLYRRKYKYYLSIYTHKKL
jgi:hypothetical protein